MTRPDLSSDQRLDAARIALAGHAADLRARFGGLDGPVGPTCPTGAPYLTFAATGLKREFEPRGLFADPLAAVQSWWVEVERYVLAAFHSRAVLYWRMRPELVLCSDGKRKGYDIRSRLVVARPPPPPPPRRRRHRKA